MIEGMQNFLTNVMSAHAPQVTTPVQKTQTYSNPFANPFLSQNLEKIKIRNLHTEKTDPLKQGILRVITTINRILSEENCLLKYNI